MSQEREIRGVSGWAMVGTLIVVMIGAGYGFVSAAQNESPLAMVAWTLVILTAAASPTLGDEVEQAGCAAFLTKPCYPSELARTLRMVMRAE